MPTLPSAKHRKTAAVATPVFVWIYLLVSLWVITGVFMDGWAHNHIPELETFFTPWHGVLYSGVLAMGVYLAIAAALNVSNGTSWKNSLPAGFGLSFIGIVVFILGGGLDLLWHTLFGIEESVEALLSPTHLILAGGAILMVTAPLRIWLSEPPLKNETFYEQLPMILSATFAFCILTFMTQFGHMAEVRAVGVMPGRGSIRDLYAAASIGGFLFQTVLLLGSIFLLMRHGKLAMGGVLLLFILNGIGMTIMKSELRLLPAMVLAGIVADTAFSSLPTMKDEIVKFRCKCFLVPAFLYLVYFLILMGSDKVWWSVHLWAGSIVMTGIMGYLLSFLVIEPYGGK